MRAQWSDSGGLEIEGFYAEDLAGGCWGEVAMLPAHHMVITDDDCNPPNRRVDMIIGVYDGGGPDYDDAIAGAEPVEYFDVYADDYGSAEAQLAAIVDIVEKVRAKYGKPISLGGGDWEGQYNPATDRVTADEWREELLEASDQALRYFPSDHDAVLLKPAVDDLKDRRELYWWLRRYLRASRDEIEDDDKPGGLGDEFVARNYFRLLDEQIEMASTTQVIGYRQASLEA